jgi:Domain of unknown function (DUF4160)
MPRLSEFFGLIIYMYWNDIQKHKSPHFHVRYQGTECVFLLSGELIQGQISRRAERLIQDWCVERKDELQKAWQCAIEGKEIPWVQPLQ